MQYEAISGGGFFVDMLGVGALTQNQVALSEHDFKVWGVSSSPSSTANLFCGQLLTQFRSCLTSIAGSHKDLKVAQLSDCAYIWSENVVAVLDAARSFMWDSVGVGLLSRGGIAYGEIVEPSKVNRSIGHFVLGSAVTRAVGLEKSGKGCRVFIDDIIYEKSLTLLNSPFKHGAVDVLRNPLNGSLVKEFCWYKTAGSTGDWQEDQHSAAKLIVTLLTKLQYSPRFNWNEASLQGRIQLACSIDSVSNVTSDFIGNGNYIIKGEEYMSLSNGGNKRCPVIYEEVLELRLKDIDRFFVNGKQKDILAHWLEKRALGFKSSLDE
ncbi:hypothetical protein [Pseudomonas baetica]|nr:hypothetical protein [Pseudomonas baetica]